VQVKLQRSKLGAPEVRKNGKRYGFEGPVYTTETQKSRNGKDDTDAKTRPYRYGEFDVLAVSMEPSTRCWDRYMYTLGRWLLPGEEPGNIAVTQPVAMIPNEFWTDDFLIAAAWLRAEDHGKRMQIVKAVKAPRAPSKPRGTAKTRTKTKSKADSSRTFDLF
jgi:hypothetical protein